MVCNWSWLLLHQQCFAMLWLAGWSPYPGNINQIVLKLDSYVQQLEKTGGIISEFVNPK
jgi:hypothetical protein